MFITEPGKNVHNYSIVKPHSDLMELTYVEGKKDENRDRAAKRVSACKYFIENTTFDYVWVGTDDLYFDVDAIEIMLRNLDKQYNTERDIVFKGHVVDFMGYTFLQGGSGWIVSRAGARKIVELGYDWLKNLSLPDDMATEDLRKMLNLSIPETATHYMYGHYFLKKVKYNFWRRKVDPCPANLPKFAAWPNNTLHPLKELVGFHHYRYRHPNRDLETQRTMNNFIEAKKNDPSLYMYFDPFYMYICRKNISG